jgi:hypothetical protein
LKGSDFYPELIQKPGQSFRDDAVLAGRPAEPGLTVPLQEARSGPAKDAKDLPVACVEPASDLFSRLALIPKLYDLVGVHGGPDVNAHMHNM